MPKPEKQLATEQTEQPWHGHAAFPIDLSRYRKVAIDPWTTPSLSSEDRAALKANIALCRDALVFFTAVGGASGYGGHTGGAFDMMPEVCIADAFFRACPSKFVPTFFDEAGHRVATQYLFAVLHGQMSVDRLLDYRVGHKALPGHPELGLTEGIKFSSGRLGHVWGHVNGVALAQPDRMVCCFSSDGSQMEGNTSEAARMAVAQKLAVKLFIDDNDTTIAGHPSSYMKGFDVGQTLRGHGLSTEDVNGEDLDALFASMCRAVLHPGPYAVVIKRNMCPGVRDLEGSNEGHDAMPLKHAVQFLESQGHLQAVELLKQVPKAQDPHESYLGAGKFGAPRQVFGETVAHILGRLPTEERQRRVLVVDNDLEGSCGLKKVGEAFPEIYVKGGIMERGNFSACAGFSSHSGRCAVFGTFAAFQEMILSEVSMARLNHCNVLCHFSHSGVDDMSDNTCHFGVNNFFSDLGLKSNHAPDTQLFFPADVHQTSKVVDAVFWRSGLRFIYTTRSKVPEILSEDGKPIFGDDYTFEFGRDDLVRGNATCDGYIVSYGDALYRSLDAVHRLQHMGLSVGLVNKCHVNVVDEDMMQTIGTSKFVLVVESQNVHTGLGLRLGTWLLERQLAPKFARCGTHREGCGGTWEQAYYQGYDSSSIVSKVLELAAHPGSKDVALKEAYKGRAVARPFGAAA